MTTEDRAVSVWTIGAGVVALVVAGCSAPSDCTDIACFPETHVEIDLGAAGDYAILTTVDGEVMRACHALVPEVGNVEDLGCDEGMTIFSRPSDGPARVTLVLGGDLSDAAIDIVVERSGVVVVDDRPTYLETRGNGGCGADCRIEVLRI